MGVEQRGSAVSEKIEVKGKEAGRLSSTVSQPSSISAGHHLRKQISETSAVSSVEL